MVKRIEDYANKTFGRLRVLSIAEERGKGGIVMLNCMCACGTTCLKRAADVRQGNTRSCGCLKVEAGKSDNQIWRKRSLMEHGDEALRHRDPWLCKAQGVARRCKTDNVEFGFKNGQALAKFIIGLNVTHCPVFGFVLVHSTGHAKFDTPSIDRVDPAKGYTDGNIQIISYLANTMKSNATAEQLKVFANWILK